MTTLANRIESTKNQITHSAFTTRWWSIIDIIRIGLQAPWSGQRAVEDALIKFARPLHYAAPEGHAPPGWQKTMTTRRAMMSRL